MNWKGVVVMCVNSLNYMNFLIFNLKCICLKLFICLYLELFGYLYDLK